MSLWGAFTNSVMALQAQSSSMGVISQNIANVNTTGYKGNTELFQTVLSESTVGTNIFGVDPVTTQQIDKQGNFQSTGLWDNLSINGQGFFILNSATDDSGKTYFTRAGNFLTATTGPNGTSTYFTDGRGDYLMGKAGGGLGQTDNTQGLTAVNYSLGSVIPGQATTQVALQGSLPAGSTSLVDASIPVYDSNGNVQSLVMNFTPNGADQWNVSFATDPTAGTITQQPGTTVTNPGPPPTTTFTPASLTFDGAGNFVTASQPITVGVSWADGTTSNISVDFSKMSQLASGQLIVNTSTQNGFGAATLVKAEFDSQGNLFGDYSNGQKVLLYQLPLATFTAPNALTESNTTLFQQNAAAGELTVSPVTALNDTSITPGAVESSNVNLENEFSNMITTQTAYNSASKVFEAADKMTQVVRDLIT